MPSMLAHRDRRPRGQALLRLGLALLCLLAGMIPPAPLGATWVPGGSLAVPRTGHTATSLTDGGVLVTGGVGPEGFGLVGETERYDPTTGRWRLTDVLTIRRHGHAAAGLADGSVLVVGGFNALIDPAATSERYQPATDTWSMSGRLQTGRAAGHTATLLTDGSVLVVGGSRQVAFGQPAFNALVGALERYTPATGAWSAAGALTTARLGHTATLLADGRVLIAGGFGASLSPNLPPVLASAEIYDPATGRSSPTNPMLAGRADHTATRLPSGAVLVVGGADLGQPSAELFEPATGRWRDVGRTTINRFGHSATLLPTGQVLVAGGAIIGRPIPIYLPPEAGFVMTELYDPVSGRWATDGRLATVRRYHTASLLPDGQVLITGGIQPGNVRTTELYRPAVTAWRLTSSPSIHPFSGLTASLADGRVLMVGQTGPPFLPGLKAELYDPTSETWTATAGPSVVAYPIKATRLNDGSILVIGGTGTGTLGAERYQPAAGAWRPAGQLARFRPAFSMTLLADGSVLVASGQPDTFATPAPGGPVPAERYDPITNTWTPAGQPAIGLDHTATLLLNGQVLVAGGGTYQAAGNGAQLYDPTTNTWTATGPLLQARARHGAARLPNGQVLVFGGTSVAQTLTSAEIYDPATGTWTLAEPLLVARSDPSVTTLPDGTIMVAGGSSSGFSNESVPAETYDPVSGRWRGVPPGLIGNLVALAPVGDGSILALGTTTYSQVLAERYPAPQSPPGPGPLTTWYLAEGFTASGTDEYLTIFNPGPAAQARVTYLPSVPPVIGGTFGPNPVVRPLALAAGGRATIRVHEARAGGNPGGLGRLTSGHGTVVESSGPIVVERSSYATYGGGIDGGHAALGATALERTWLFAEGYTGPGFDEYLTIVNPGPAGQAVIFYYVEGQGALPPRIIDLPAASRATVAVHGNGFPNSGALGRLAAGHAVKVEATVDVAVERVMYFAYGAGIDGAHVTGGVAAPATTWLFAEGYTGPGFDEYLTIFNPGPAGSATITYAIEGQTAATTRVVPLAATSRTTIAVHQPVGPTNPGGLGRLTAGHATRVETTVPVVVERPMYFHYTPSIDGGHLVLGATATATRWAFAEGYTGPGFDEYLTIFNPGAAGLATISYRLEGQAGPLTRQVALAAGSRTTVAVHQPESATNPGGLGRQASGHATLVESDMPIVVERPMYFAYAPGVTGGHVVSGARLP